MQALSSAGFKSTVRGSHRTDCKGSDGTSANPTTSEVMAAKRAAKQQKLRDVTFKLIVSAR